MHVVRIESQRTEPPDGLVGNAHDRRPGALERTHPELLFEPGKRRQEQRKTLLAHPAEGDPESAGERRHAHRRAKGEREDGSRPRRLHIAAEGSECAPLPPCGGWRDPMWKPPKNHPPEAAEFVARQAARVFGPQKRQVRRGDLSRKRRNAQQHLLAAAAVSEVVMRKQDSSVHPVFLRPRRPWSLSARWKRGPLPPEPDDGRALRAPRQQRP